jgi:threonine synthase
MKYISTRGGMKPASFSNIVLGGLAPDGGLTVPEKLPQYSLNKLKEMKDMSYPELAFEIISKFATDIPKEDLETLIKKTYTKETFGTDDITPLVTLWAEGNMHMLELSNGPTYSFKDVALQFLGNLFEYLLSKNDDYMNILAATSGDTGSAAIYGVKGKERIRIFVLTPYERMSKIQTAQMYSVLDNNVFNVAIKGVFDDCQKLVKDVNNDADFKKQYHIGAVNSINLARVIAQMVYYFKGYFAAVSKEGLNVGHQVDFAVPTGNFGNILSGYYARKMGLPIGKLVLATNENDVLDKFFAHHFYKPTKSEKVIKTNSPSMDIAEASNFERYIFDITGRDPSTVKYLMSEIKKNGFFSLIGEIEHEDLERTGLHSGTANAKDRAKAIKDIYSKSGGVIIDTHTANAVSVAMHYADHTPMVVLSTAKPAKFEEDMAKILPGVKIPMPAELESIAKKEQRYEVMEKDLPKLMNYVAEKALVINKQQ